MDIREIIVIPTYNRPEYLFYCITLIRAFEQQIPIAVFPDRGTANDPELRMALSGFDPNLLVVNYVPKHDYYGNSYNVMEAFRWAYNSRFERIYYIEDDVMVHHDFFKWHRSVHEDEDFGAGIFCSMAWVFNHYAPINEDLLFQPWYYSIGTCFSREKLLLIAEHATPRYYESMDTYIEREFKQSKLNDPVAIGHYEQDGLIQRIMDRDKSQAVSSGMGRCTHLGTFGYNTGWEKRDQIFSGCGNFAERVEQLSRLVGDPYWRAQLFGREIVEREIGKILEPRFFKYKVTVGEFQSEYLSEVQPEQFPPRINSVPVTPEMQFVLE